MDNNDVSAQKLMEYLLEPIKEELEESGEKYDAQMLVEYISKIKLFYSNPDLIENQPEDKKEFYERYVNLLKERVENKPMELQLSTVENLNGKNGFLNIIFLSLIMIMLVMLVIYIMN